MRQMNEYFQEKIVKAKIKKDEASLQTLMPKSLKKRLKNQLKKDNRNIKQFIVAATKCYLDTNATKTKKSS